MLKKKCNNKVFDTGFTCGEEGNVCSEKCLDKLRPKGKWPEVPQRRSTFVHNKDAEKVLNKQHCVSTYDVEFMDIDVKTLRSIIEKMNENDVLRLKVDYEYGGYDGEGSATVELHVGENNVEPEEEWFLRRAKQNALIEKYRAWYEIQTLFHKNRMDHVRPKRGPEPIMHTKRPEY